MTSEVLVVVDQLIEYQHGAQMLISESKLQKTGIRGANVGGVDALKSRRSPR